MQTGWNSRVRHSVGKSDQVHAGDADAQKASFQPHVIAMEAATRKPNISGIDSDSVLKSRGDGLPMMNSQVFLQQIRAFGISMMSTAHLSCRACFDLSVVSSLSI
jgi:hypothetical protein